MSILDQARKDTKQIMTDALKGFAFPVTLTDTQAETATVDALGTKHHLKVSQEGLPTNSRTASVQVHIDTIHEVNSSYSFRNGAGEIDFMGHEVQFTDSFGVTSTYKVEEQFPDDHLGLVVLILGLYS